MDADRRLGQALEASSYRLAADALLLQRACGLRIGEMLDLELDCVHEVPGHGSWLKVPLGKLKTERMVPLDEETLALLDRIAATRSPGRPIPHPRTGRPAQFLFTHHGRRLSQNALREELNRAADRAGLGHVTPHQLRHTYATALVNAGVSLQSWMALLGHVSAQMSLRYARLFDTTVRSEYERALDLAKSRIGPLPADRPTLPLLQAGSDWKDTPTARHASPAATAYAPRHRAPAPTPTSASTAPASAPTPATSACSPRNASTPKRCSPTRKPEARHRRLLNRLDALLAQTHAETG